MLEAARPWCINTKRGGKGNRRVLPFRLFGSGSPLCVFVYRSPRVPRIPTEAGGLSPLASVPVQGKPATLTGPFKFCRLGSTSPRVVFTSTTRRIRANLKFRRSSTSEAGPEARARCYACGSRVGTKRAQAGARGSCARERAAAATAAPANGVPVRPAVGGPPPARAQRKGGLSGVRPSPGCFHAGTCWLLVPGH